MSKLYKQTDSLIEQLYIKLFPKLIKYVLHFIHNQHVAEDIVQDTFEVVIKRKDKLAEHENVEGWIFLICRNMIKKYFSSNRICTVDIESVDYLIESNYFETYITLIMSMDLMSNLDLEEKNIVLLHFLFGYKFNEIAKMRMLQEGACKMKCYRAIRKIRKIVNNRK